MTIFPLTESARGTPLRSRMSPRSATSGSRTAPSAAARTAYERGSTPWSWTSLAPKKDRTIAMRTNPMRSRSIGAPREAPRLVRVLGTGLLISRSAPCWIRPARQSRCAVPSNGVTAPSAVAVLAGLGVRRPGVRRGLLLDGRGGGHLDVRRRGREDRRLDRRRRLQLDGVLPGGRRPDAGGLAGLEVEEHRGRRDHHSHRLRLGRHALRVAE